MAQRRARRQARARRSRVCVIAYKSGPTLRTCLERLGAQTFRDFETIVIDNASPDPGDVAIAGEFPWARLIRNGENLGFTGGGQPGRARRRAGRWYVLLNPDAYAEPDWLETAGGGGQAASAGVVLHLAPDGGRTSPACWTAWAT